MTQERREKGSDPIIPFLILSLNLLIDVGLVALALHQLMSASKDDFCSLVSEFILIGGAALLVLLLVDVTFLLLHPERKRFYGVMCLMVPATAVMLGFILAQVSVRPARRFDHECP